jgi:hypothetical protein
MAFTRELKANHREEVRGELGNFLTAHPHPALRGGAMFIGSSFELYSLTLGGIARATNGVDLADCLTKTGRWQHQILMQRKSRAIAFSSSRGDIRDSIRVTGVMAAPAAGKIDRAIKWIDRERPDDRIEVFFFIVPAFQLQAFLLKGLNTEEVFVVSSPAKSHSLDEGTACDVGKFLTELRGTRAIVGISARHSGNS